MSISVSWGWCFPEVEALDIGAGGLCNNRVCALQQAADWFAYNIPRTNGTEASGLIARVGEMVSPSAASPIYAFKDPEPTKYVLRWGAYEAGLLTSALWRNVLVRQVGNPFIFVYPIERSATFVGDYKKIRRSRGALPLPHIKRQIETIQKLADTIARPEAISYVSLRGNLLLLDDYGALAGRESFSVLTVEMAPKWYELWLLELPPGRALRVPFPDSFSDHCPEPKSVRKLAEERGWCLDELAYEAIVGRWECEVMKNWE